MKKLLNGMLMVLGAACALSLGVEARQAPQQSGAPAPETHRHRGGEQDGMRREGGPGRFLRGLNLTGEQQQQVRAIREKYRQSTQAQREELRQLFQQRQTGQLTPEQETRARQLRRELRQTGEREQQELLAVLTPEQRQQIEQRRQEFEQRRQERQQEPNANQQ